MLHGHWNSGVGIIGMGPSNVLCIFLQKMLKNILVSPKDEEKSLTRTVLFIATPVEVLTVGEEYIGESGRSFGGKIQRTFEGPIPNIPTPEFQWPCNINR